MKTATIKAPRSESFWPNVSEHSSRGGVVDPLYVRGLDRKSGGEEKRGAKLHSNKTNAAFILTKKNNASILDE